MTEPIYPETPWDDPYFDPGEDAARERAYEAAMENAMAEEYYQAMEAAEAQHSADYEPPTPEEREELDRLGSSNA